MSAICQHVAKGEKTLTTVDQWPHKSFHFSVQPVGVTYIYHRTCCALLKLAGKMIPFKSSLPVKKIKHTTTTKTHKKRWEQEEKLKEQVMKKKEEKKKDTYTKKDTHKKRQRFVIFVKSSFEQECWT